MADEELVKRICARINLNEKAELDAKNKTDKVYVLGTGSQAPYGIDEIIDIIPLSHWKKILTLCNKYYNPPKLRLNSKTGPRLKFEWDYHISSPGNPEIIGITEDKK